MEATCVSMQNGYHCSSSRLNSGASKKIRSCRGRNLLVNLPLDIGRHFWLNYNLFVSFLIGMCGSLNYELKFNLFKGIELN